MVYILTIYVLFAIKIFKRIKITNHFYLEFNPMKLLKDLLRLSGHVQLSVIPYPEVI